MEQGYADRLLTTVDGVRQRVLTFSNRRYYTDDTIFECLVYVGPAWCALSAEITFIRKITVPISYTGELL